MSHAVLAPEVAYDRAASEYDDWSWQSFWRTAEAPLIESIVGSAAGSSGERSLLDVGCGTGFYADLLADRFGAVSGVDLSSNMLAAARARLPTARFLQGSITSLPFFDRMFDVVMCARVLSHVDDLENALKEMYRVLRPGGMLIVTNVDAGHPYGDTRLPTPSGDVFAATYKHHRADVLEKMSGLGLIIMGTWLLTADGRHRPDDASSGTAEGVVGWVASGKLP